MECNIKTCIMSQDCEILEIIKKQPKNEYSCSYMKTQKQIDKINEKKMLEADAVKPKFKKKPQK